MVSEAHVVSMQRVDQIKIPPHEPVASVYRCTTALENARPGIKRPTCRQAVPLQCLGAHAARLKRDSVVAIVLVEPPRVIQQPAFRLESLVQRRPGKGREMIERSDVKTVFLSEPNRLAETLWSVTVVAKDKRAIDTNVVTAQVLEGLLKTAVHGVECFVHVFQVR